MNKIFIINICCAGEDLDAWKENTVYVNWKVTDTESGLEYCEWAIGKIVGNYKSNNQRIVNPYFLDLNVKS